MKSYRDLEIFKESFNLAVEVHNMTLNLPKFELYEEGSQVRRASKSIPANITEGYGRKNYKADFIRFLVFAHASCDETIVHLEFLRKTHQELNIEPLIDKYSELGKKIYAFILYVEKNWKS